jgi:beta-xylosidase
MPVTLFEALVFSQSSMNNHPKWGTWQKWGMQNNGVYNNPVLPADFSDLDCIRVGDDYYAISSTFQYSPGMAVLHSKDLVNWKIIGHAVKDIRQIGPEMNWDRMNRYGRGIWAGSIRYHNGKFYVLFGAPEEGFFTTWAENPAGPWAPLTNIFPESGWNDCSALWDDDGKAFFIGNMFKNRAYENYIFDMAPDCSSIDFESKRLVFKGDGREAAKLIKVGQWYYIIYSRVENGARYLVAKRSKTMTGEWSEEKQLMAPNRESKEPNQGGIIEGPDGKWYFFTHHGNGDWEGRAASLLPVTWIDEWPIPGKVGEDGLGYMVWTGAMPLIAKKMPDKTFRDDFKSKTLNLNWEWNYYPRNEMWSLSERKGWLRIKAVKPLKDNDLKKTPNILTQRVYRTLHNEATVKMDVRKMEPGQVAGLCHYARTYSYIGILREKDKLCIVFNENGESKTQDIAHTKTIWFRSVWGLDGLCRLSYSTDGKTYSEFGKPYQFTWGDYRGTRIGLFTFCNEEKGYVDIDCFEYLMI